MHSACILHAFCHLPEAPKETLMLIPRQLTTDSEVKERAAVLKPWRSQDVRQMSGCEVEVMEPFRYGF